MKKLLSLLAIVAFTGTISAQSTSTDDAPKAEGTETVKSCAKGDAALPACCAAKAKASAQVGAAATAPKAETAAPSCHGAKAEAGGATSAPAAAHPGMPACCAAKANASGAACAGGKAHTDAEPAHK